MPAVKFKKNNEENDVVGKIINCFFMYRTYPVSCITHTHTHCVCVMMRYKDNIRLFYSFWTSRKKKTKKRIQTWRGITTLDRVFSFANGFHISQTVCKWELKRGFSCFLVCFCCCCYGDNLRYDPFKSHKPMYAPHAQRFLYNTLIKRAVAAGA